MRMWAIPWLSAQRWMAANMPAWKKNRAHYYAPINEQDPATLVNAKWLNDFTVECLRIADENGFKLALYGFSSGNPKDGGSDTAPFTLEQVWEELLPSMQYAKQHGHILLLHEYGFGSPAANGGPDTSLRASYPYLAGRFIRSLAYLAQHDADTLVVVSELGAGVGGIGELSVAEYIADVEWWDLLAERYPNVIGGCLYQAGGAENIRHLFPALTQYIVSTKDRVLPVVMQNVCGSRIRLRSGPSLSSPASEGHWRQFDVVAATSQDSGVSTGCGGRWLSVA